jgi:hypothetical protein
MVMRKASGFTIQYYRDMIVLSGAMDAIHLEAEKGSPTAPGPTR